MSEWVLAAERAYVAAATGGPHVRAATAHDVAAAGAVASRFLAVGTPRSFGIIGDDALSLEAHRTWFTPRDVRCTSPEVAAAVGGRVVSIDEALVADIVCVHCVLEVSAAQLRRGTHLNALAAVTLDPELVVAAYDEVRDLPALAAGLVDGRQGDEITVFRLSLR